MKIMTWNIFIKVDNTKEVTLFVENEKADFNEISDHLPLTLDFDLI